MGCFSEAFQRLIDLGVVGYGNVVTRSQMEHILGAKYSDSWEWLGPYLTLRTEIIENGYFISSRKVEEGAIRFLRIDEIPDQLQKRRLRRYKEVIIDSQVASKIPQIDLAERERKTLFHEQQKSANEIARLSKEDKEFSKLFCST